ncbi:hypothetical protein EB796_016578 [Bugula neritina]|uniref:Uncharacterized protein n=1 Tax=Bugula neritina TaxID=10212 RepID=A0A7J7JFM0_BUGNE|nr:hypothetical protein EB796_016578 [Bugula neritina]
MQLVFSSYLTSSIEIIFILAEIKTKPITECGQSNVEEGEDTDNSSSGINTSPVYGPSKTAALSRAESSSSLDSNWQITLPCFNVGIGVTTEVDLAENLLIEHASMSVYESLPSAYSNPEGDSSNERGVVATGRPAQAVCLGNRRYDLRKLESRKAKKSKKVDTKRAYNRRNQVTHIQQRNCRRPSPIMVFQPRK